MPDTQHSIIIQDKLDSVESKLDNIVDKDGNIKKTFLRWLFGQESSSIALWLVFIGGAYGFYWVGTTLVPIHLQMIQSGYKEVLDRNEKLQKEIADADRAEHAAQRISHEKAMERFERSFEAGFKAAIDRSKELKN